MSIIKNAILLDYKDVTSGNGDANSSNDSVFVGADNWRLPHKSSLWVGASQAAEKSKIMSF